MAEAVVIVNERGGGDRADADPRTMPCLDTLIGRPRAAILQCLECPACAGDIAQSLYMLPGGMTYHLRSLEAAGLVTRTRRGPNVIVERTDRGTALVALYDPADGAGPWPAMPPA
jgi:DNA-binding transcriptional ArsR family regulator